MRSRLAGPDFAKLARRARDLRGSCVLALGMTALAACVDLSPPWQGAKQDAAEPLGSGGGFILADASAVGGNAGAPGPIEGVFPTDAPASSSWDASVHEAGVGALDGSLPSEVARADAQEVSPDAEVGSSARTDSGNRDTEGDVSLAGSGGAGGAALDAGSGGTAGGGTGGLSGVDAADLADRDFGADSAAGGTGTGGMGSGGSSGTGTGGTSTGGMGTGGTGTGGTGTGGSNGGVCATYHGRDAGSGIDDDQIAYYRCESAVGSSGTGLEDSSGHGHDATLHTGAGGADGYSFITGKVHGALHLVAAQQGFVTLPAGLLDNACEATIATWVWLDSSQKWQRIFDFGRDSSVYMFLSPKSNGSENLRFAISVDGIDGEQTIDGTEELPTGAWYHVAVVLGPAGGALYVNANKVGSNAGLTLRPADLGELPNLYLGRSQFSKDPYYDGNIDSFRIYDRALSDAEIREVYQYDGT